MPVHSFLVKFCSLILILGVVLDYSLQAYGFKLVKHHYEVESSLSSVHHKFHPDLFTPKTLELFRDYDANSTPRSTSSTGSTLPSTTSTTPSTTIATVPTTKPSTTKTPSSSATTKPSTTETPSSSATTQPSTTKTPSSSATTLPTSTTTPSPESTSPSSTTPEPSSGSSNATMIPIFITMAALSIIFLIILLCIVANYFLKT